MKFRPRYVRLVPITGIQTMVLKSKGLAVMDLWEQILLRTEAATGIVAGCQAQS